MGSFFYFTKIGNIPSSKIDHSYVKYGCIYKDIYMKTKWTM